MSIIEYTTDGITIPNDIIDIINPFLSSFSYLPKSDCTFMIDNKFEVIINTYYIIDEVWYEKIEDYLVMTPFSKCRDRWSDKILKVLQG